MTNEESRQIPIEPDILPGAKEWVHAVFNDKGNDSAVASVTLDELETPEETGSDWAEILDEAHAEDSNVRAKNLFIAKLAELADKDPSHGFVRQLLFSLNQISQDPNKVKSELLKGEQLLALIEIVQACSRDEELAQSLDNIEI